MPSLQSHTITPAVSEGETCLYCCIQDQGEFEHIGASASLANVPNVGYPLLSEYQGKDFTLISSEKRIYTSLSPSVGGVYACGRRQRRARTQTQRLHVLMCCRSKSTWGGKKPHDTRSCCFLFAFYLQLKAQ